MYRGSAPFELVIVRLAKYFQVTPSQMLEEDLGWIDYTLDVVTYDNKKERLDSKRNELRIKNNG